MSTKSRPAAKKEEPPPGKSRSARANPHDWTQMLNIIYADSIAHPTIDFEERCVHAIQKALEGRDNKPLF